MRQIQGIETDRLLLRPFRESDFHAVHAYGSDPAVTRFTDFGPNREEDTKAFLAEAIRCSEIDGAPGWEFAVEECSSAAFLGAAGIRFIGNKAAEIGYCYPVPSWGRGIATETASALLKLAFESLKLHRVQARCDPRNAASARVLQKIGMVREGRLRECVYIRGAWVDRDMWSVLEHEWGQDRSIQTAAVESESGSRAPHGG